MLSRRSFLFTASTLLAQKRRPNVLFIATDDLNNALACYGHPVVKTPNLDRLAARGVRFDRAYTQFALCSPSRSSLMTGLGPDTTQVYNLTKHFRSVLPDVVTLGQCAQKNGYFTARVGKIYHYGNPGQIGTNGLDDEPTWNQRINPKGIDKAEEPKVTNHTPGKGLGSSISFYASPAPDEEHTDGMVAAETIQLLEKHQKEPFFLAAGFYRPHCPYIAPKKYFDLYPPEKLEPIPFTEGEDTIAPPWAYWTKPPNWNMTRRQQQEDLQAYYASISFVDANVGKLLDALDRLGLTENTVIVFWSDHGYGTGEHGQWMKQTVFEAATRVPLLMAGPGVTAKGKGCPRTVELLDLYPTLADLCGFTQVPGNLHGVSLRPLLRNPQAKWDRPAISQVSRNRNQQADSLQGYSIRTERYRYTEWAGGQEGVELYDYQADPKEMQNLGKSDRHAKLRGELQSKLREITKSRGRRLP
ncbi:MAG: sulfatase [Bryobacteraceae bacterium]|nr:sulfatase [Bryobacteraceae bacterium]